MPAKGQNGAPLGHHRIRALLLDRLRGSGAGSVGFRLALLCCLDCIGLVGEQIHVELSAARGRCSSAASSKCRASPSSARLRPLSAPASNPSSAA